MADRGSIPWNVVGPLESLAYAFFTAWIMLAAYYYVNENVAGNMPVIATFWMFVGYFDILVQVVWMGSTPPVAKVATAVQVISGILPAIACSVVLAINLIVPDMVIDGDGWLVLGSAIAVALIELAMVLPKLKMLAAARGETETRH